jgi:hypothetical protein
LEQLAKNGNVLKNRKVKLALVEHPKTPRHVSLPLVRQLYTFDLMQIALTPVVPADVKRAADDVLCSKLETISQGERLTLAHRGSRRIAEALLSDAETRVMHAALQNSRLTESAIVRALARPGSSAALWRRCVITHNGRRGGKCGSLCSAMRRLRWRVRRPLLALSRLVWCGRFCTARGCRGV